MFNKIVDMKKRYYIEKVKIYKRLLIVHFLLGYEIVIQERKPGARRSDQTVIDQRPEQIITQSGDN